VLLQKLLHNKMETVFLLKEHQTQICNRVNKFPQLLVLICITSLEPSANKILKDLQSKEKEMQVQLLQLRKLLQLRVQEVKFLAANLSSLQWEQQVAFKK
jgi:hypothetical protein